nr:MAG TPA: hypothetical protein [Caudoviricetes sp.]
MTFFDDFLKNNFFVKILLIICENKFKKIKFEKYL